MTTKYEIIEGDHWKRERLNREFNRGYFVQMNVDGKIYYRTHRGRII
jgi:hypothetical protein